MAIDFKDVKSIKGPGGKEVIKITRTSDNVVLWKTSIKRVEITPASYNIDIAYWGQEHSPQIIPKDTSNRYVDIKPIITTAISEGYKYIRMYWEKDRTMYWEYQYREHNVEAGQKYSFYGFNIWGNKTTGTGSSKYMGLRITNYTMKNIISLERLTTVTPGCTIVAFTLPKETKTDWCELKTIPSNMENLYLDILGSDRANHESWNWRSQGTYNTIYGKFKKIIGSETLPAATCIMEFSKTGTEE